VYESNLNNIHHLYSDVSVINIDYIIKETERLIPLNIKTHIEFIKLLELFKIYESKKKRPNINYIDFRSAKRIIFIKY
jgi:hypothetical protein